MDDINCNKGLTADYMNKTEKYESNEETYEKHNQWNHGREKEKRYKSTTNQGNCGKIKRRKMLVLISAVSVLLLFSVAIVLLNDYVTEIDCGAPPDVLYSSYQKTGTNQGATAVYRCLKGYVSNGDGKLHCHDNGQWSNISFSCMKDCSSPPYVSHSTHLKTRNKSRIVSFYHCVHGYYLVGKPTILCQDDGQWSNISFSCFKFCSLPPHITHSVNNMTGNMSGAVASYSCLPGYFLVGEPNIVCNDNGDWSTTNMLCVKDCGVPPNVSHSRFQKSGNTTGVFGSYQCLHGYYPAGEPILVCQNNGLWSKVAFSCLKYCGLPAQISKSTNHMAGNMSGAITTYSCLPGYYLIGVPDIVCEENGEWSAVKFSCLKDCPAPPKVSHGVSHKIENKTGVFASYQCQYGYYPVGEPTIVCQKHGFWSTVRVSCLKYCLSPPHIFQSTNQVTGNKSGAIAFYRCLSGYHLTGKPKIVCEKNGKWSDVKFSCLKDCGIPPTKRFAKADYTNTYSGSWATYYCTSGFIGFGDHKTLCQSNGEWTAINFQCARKQQWRPVSHHGNSRSNGVKNRSSWIYVLIIGVLMQVLFVNS